MTQLSGSIEQKNELATAPIAEVPQAVEKPKAVEPKVTEPSKPQIVVDLQYRLSVFSPSGTIKPSVSVPMYQDMCRRNAEIIRSLSSTKWMTMDEILEKVWQMEKKMRYPSGRTRKSVETAIKELLEREMVDVR